MGLLFMRIGDATDLETFARRVFALLELEIKGTRFSDNSPGGRYVYGETLGLRVRLTEADDADFPDYDFMLSLRPRTRWNTTDTSLGLDGLADIVARHLAVEGMKIARPLEVGKAGSARVEYGGNV